MEGPHEAADMGVRPSHAPASIPSALQAALEQSDTPTLTALLRAHAKRVRAAADAPPTALAHAGDLPGAWARADRPGGELRVLWHLLLAWDRAEEGHPDEARPTLARLMAGPLPAFYGWWRVCALLLAPIHDIDRDAFQMLHTALLDPDERVTLYEQLTALGQPAAAIASALAITDVHSRLNALRAIALTQIEIGDPAGARDLLSRAVAQTAELDSAEERAEQLADLALALAQASAMEQARQTAATAGEVARGTQIFERLFWIADRIVRALATCGDTAAALETMSRIATEEQRAASLTTIAEAIARRGDAAAARMALPACERLAASIESAEYRHSVQRAAALLDALTRDWHGALANARSIAELYRRAETLGEIAAVASQVGLETTGDEILAEAVTTARQLEEDGAADGTLFTVVDTLATAGAFAAAHRIAGEIEEPAVAIQALATVAVALAKSNRHAEALELCARLMDRIHDTARERWHAWVLPILADAQQCAGDTEGARATLRAAAQTTRELLTSDEQHAALSDIAQTLLRTAGGAAARNVLVDALQGDELHRSSGMRDRKLDWMAAQQRHAGALDDALASAWLISDADTRAEALIAIADAHSARGNTDGAGRTLAAAFMAATGRTWDEKPAADDPPNQRWRPPGFWSSFISSLIQASQYGIAREVVQELPSAAERVRALGEIAFHEARAGAPEAAHTTLAATLAVLPESDDPRAAAEARLWLVATYFLLGDVAVARELAAAERKADTAEEWPASALVNDLGVLHRIQSLIRSRNTEEVADLARVIGTSHDGYRVLRDAALDAEIRAGGLSQALQNAEGIPDPRQRAEVLQSLAMRLLRVGDNLQAVAIARRIETRNTLVETLATVAAAHFDAGKSDTARALLDEAEQLALTVKPREHRTRAWAALATAQAHTGDAAAALRSARRMPTHQVETFRDIAAIQAQRGAVAVARETAATIRDQEQRANALAAIAAAQVLRGDFTGAAETASTIEIAWQRAVTRASVAAAQAGAGDLAGTTLPPLLDAAREEALELKSPQRRVEVLLAVARAFEAAAAPSGACALLATAVGTLPRIADRDHAGELGAAIAHAQVRAGDLAGAAQTAVALLPDQEHHFGSAAAVILAAEDQIGVLPLLLGALPYPDALERLCRLLASQPDRA